MRRALAIIFYAAMVISLTCDPVYRDEEIDLQKGREFWGRHWLDVARFAESTGGGRTLFACIDFRYLD